MAGTEISRIHAALPLNSIEAGIMAIIFDAPGVEPRYTWDSPTTYIYAPPAARKLPYVDARLFIECVGRASGLGAASALASAEAVWAQLRPRLSVFDRACRFDDGAPMSLHETAPIELLLEEAQRHKIVSNSVLDFWERVVRKVTAAPLFPGRAFDSDYRAIAQVPDLPEPLDLFEFICGLPHGIENELCESNGEGRSYHELTHFVRWREQILPVVQRLESVFGTWLYHFADFDCDTDDDAGHRFLALHLLVSCLPNCPFVGYLIEASGMRSTQELLQALEEPDSYSLPFEPWDAFGGRDLNLLRLRASEI